MRNVGNKGGNLKLCRLRESIEGDSDSLDPCYTHDFSYNFYAKHIIGLLELLVVFYSAKCEVKLLGLKSYCY